MKDKMKNKMKERVMDAPQADPDIAFLCVKAMQIFYGFIGGAMTAVLGEGSWRVKAMTVVFGMISSFFMSDVGSDFFYHYVQPFGVSYQHISGPVGLLCGLTGMIICRTVIQFAQHMKDRV
jgi:hypothetical protein